VRCPDWASGLGHSLRSGIEAAGGADAVVIVLGDGPLLSPEAVARVVRGRSPSHPVVRATYHGRDGHPVLIEGALLPRIMRLRGDLGARRLLGMVPVARVRCDDLGSPGDVDTPQDLLALERPDRLHVS